MDILKQFSSYLAAHGIKLKKATMKGYTNDVAQFLAWYQHTYATSFSPQEIQNKSIEQYIQSLKVSPASKQHHLSSLRKFFAFLKSEGIIGKTPFEQKTKNKEEILDAWKLTDFSNYLYVYNASELTIKHYMIDIKHFFEWMNTTHQNVPITETLLKKYKDYLTKHAYYAESTINRKHSAIRKYYTWLRIVS